MNKTKRLDVLLVESNYCESRNKANYLIKNGYVSIDGKPILDISKKFSLNEELNIVVNKEYLNVSRAFTKLEKAIEKFNVSIENLICVDIGSSTGGFVECLLKNNAKKIYAIDVGKDQLNKELKNNDKIISMESTNFVKIDKEQITEKINFITCDVSFISCKKIINKILELGWKKFEAIILFKPQFEIGKEIISKSKGYVDEKLHNKLILDFINFLKSNKFENIKYIDSPITGKKMNNKEYLFYIQLNDNE